MRQSYPLIWCLPHDTQAKLLGKVSDPDILPARAWSEWPPIEFKLIPVSDRDKEYIKLRETARFMSQRSAVRSKG